MIDSASPGMPRSPSRAALKPSCATPSPLSDGSSQWSITGMPNRPAYSSARRISSAVCDRLAVVGHRDAARLPQLAELGELLALRSDA